MTPPRPPRARRPYVRSTNARRLAELRVLSRQVYEGLADLAIEQGDPWAAGQMLEAGKFLDASVRSLDHIAERLGVR